MVVSLEVNSESHQLCNYGMRCITNSMQHLQLNGLFKGDTIRQFFDQNFEGLKSFCFNVPHEDGQTKTPGNLLKLLSKFKNIEHLELNDEFTLDFNESEMSEIKELYPNLVSFKSQGSCLANKIINLYSDKLEALSINDCAQIGIPNDTHFEKLSELTVSAASQATFDKILKATSNLEKVRISSNMNASELKTVIQALIKGQPQLKYLEAASCDNTFQSMFDGVEKGLFFTRQQKREYFKVRIFVECSGDVNIDLNDVMILISRITHMLQLSKARNFMIICTLRGKGASVMDRDVILKTAEDFGSCARPKVIVNTFCDDGNQTIVVSNNRCTINGYSESRK